MRVLIVGCGYVGLAAGAELVRQGHQVWGLRRTNQANAELSAVGVVPLRADITKPEALAKLRPCYDWVLHCVSASGGGPREYEQIYLQGTGHLLDWLSQAPPARLVYTSSTSVYRQTDGSTVDETSATQPQTPTGRVLVETEKLLFQRSQQISLAPVVLRVAGIYGPGRAYWLDQFLTGTPKLDGDGSRILNMIHRDDVAGAAIAILARGDPGKIYNAVDDQPVTQLELFEWLAHRLPRPLAAPGPVVPTAFGFPSGAPRPLAAAAKRGLTSKKVSNRRLKQELGYQFRFPTFRHGFEQILRSVSNE